MAANIFARFLSILLLSISTHSIHVAEINYPTDVCCVFVHFTRLLKHREAGKRNLPSRPISHWHKHGHILLYRPFKLDLTIFIDVESNPGPTGDLLLHTECLKCVNGGVTSVVTIDFDRMNYGPPCLGYTRYVYSRDELLQLRCCVSGLSAPVFDDYGTKLSNGMKAKYRRCRAGKKVKERRRYLSNPIPVIARPCSSGCNNYRENLHALNKTRKSYRSIVKVKLVDLPGPTNPTIIPNCMVINAHSLVKPDAAAALYCDLKSNKIDICLVSETWLNSSVPSHLVCPEGFTIIRKDRNDSRVGGSVAIFCRNDWKIQIYDSGTDFECLWCNVSSENSEYFIAAVYNPPDPIYNEADLIEYLMDTCEKIMSSDPNARIIIGGDINKLNVMELIVQHSLQQMVKLPTRGERVLDVFLTNYPLLWRKPIVFNSLVRSDHRGVLVPPRITTKSVRKNVLFRDVREHRKLQMDRKLKNLEWDIFFDCENPSENVQKLNDILSNMFDECFPLISIKMSSRDPPFITPLVKHLCKIRNKNRHRDNAALQERINALIRENQLNAIRCENRKHMKGSKAWWDTTNRISGRNKQNVQISSIVSAEEINDYFKEINTDPNYITPVRLQIPDTVQVPEVGIDVVKHELLSLKRTSSGPDGLPYWFWRDYANFLAPVLTHIFNISIRKQMVPLLWKSANVVPIPKESPLQEVGQLRPISLTNIMTIFERLVFRQELFDPLSLEIGANQFAYKQGQNCTVALIKCYHSWLKWLDGDADFVRVFAFDFKKAFDHVSHYILSEKIKALNVNLISSIGLLTFSQIEDKELLWMENN